MPFVLDFKSRANISILIIRINTSVLIVKSMSLFGKLSKKVLMTHLVFIRFVQSHALKNVNVPPANVA